MYHHLVLPQQHLHDRFADKLKSMGKYWEEQMFETSTQLVKSWHQHAQTFNTTYFLQEKEYIYS